MSALSILIDEIGTMPHEDYSLIIDFVRYVKHKRDNDFLQYKQETSKTIQELFELYPADYIHEEEVDWGTAVGEEI